MKSSRQVESGAQLEKSEEIQVLKENRGGAGESSVEAEAAGGGNTVASFPDAGSLDEQKEGKVTQPVQVNSVKTANTPEVGEVPEVSKTERGPESAEGKDQGSLQKTEFSKH